jgi:hypothetical protein
MHGPTGELGTFDELIENGSRPEDLIRIQRDMMTARQESEGFVALNDSKTPLGRLRQQHDPRVGAKSSLTRNQRKRQRKAVR